MRPQDWKQKPGARAPGSIFNPIVTAHITAQGRKAMAATRRYGMRRACS